MASSSTWSEPPWSGWIENTGDALLILEAARRGLIPRVTRRLTDAERKGILSGYVFVFDEDESGIKRWTDGFFWSPSRILGNFLLYRETDKRGAGHRAARTDNEFKGDNKDPVHSLSRPKSDIGNIGIDKHRERTLVGSLTNSYKFKPEGLMKKTFSLTVNGVAQHLISYYRVEDVECGRLRSPSTLPELASLTISAEYLDKTHFRNPPKVEVGPDGVPRYRGEADDVENQIPHLSLVTSAPLSSMPQLEKDRRLKRHEPYAVSGKRPRRTKSEAESSASISPTSPRSTATAGPSSGLMQPQYPQPFPASTNYYPIASGQVMQPPIFPPMSSTSQHPPPPESESPTSPQSPQPPFSGYSNYTQTVPMQAAAGSSTSSGPAVITQQQQPYYGYYHQQPAQAQQGHYAQYSGGWPSYGGAGYAPSPEQGGPSGEGNQEQDSPGEPATSVDAVAHAHQ